jgi:hypothetical protein
MKHLVFEIKFLHLHVLSIFFAYRINMYIVYLCTVGPENLYVLVSYRTSTSGFCAKMFPCATTVNISISGGAFRRKKTATRKRKYQIIRKKISLSCMKTSRPDS